MTDTKITSMTEATSLAYEEDVFECVDVSTNTNKKIKAATLLGPAAAEETGASYTFALADAFKTKIFNSGSAQAITIPTNTNAPFPIGTRIRCYRKGAGLPKISPDSGVTLNLPTGITPKRFMGALVKKSADELTANYSSGVTGVAWDAETYDTDGFHDNVTNNSRLTVPSNLGIKRVVLSNRMQVANVTSGSFLDVAIAKDGAFAYAGQPGIRLETTTTAGNIEQTSPPLDCVDGTYFQVWFQVESDTSVDVESDSSWFSIEVTQIDAQGYIAYQHGAVEIEKIGTNEWIFVDQTALG